MHDVARSVGRYDVLGEIGRGGMSIVYCARQIYLDRVVALKEFTGLRSDPASDQRFLREARVAGSLSHPSIVTVYEYFEHDETPYIAMEYLERGSLRPYVGHLSLVQIGGVLDAVLTGLARAEALALVHRDLKPENLLVTADGTVKIADFGLIAAIDRGDATTVAGTPAYMAPEQAMGLQPGPWSDLYSLGCIAFELLTGRLPFDRFDPPALTLLRHVNEPIPSLNAVDPEVPSAIAGWVDWLLTKDPDKRARSAASAWDALESILIGLIGPRWRRDSRLTEPPERHVPLTPAPFISSPAGPPPDDDSQYVTFEGPPLGPPARAVDDETALPAEPVTSHTGAFVPIARAAEPLITRRTPHLDVSPAPSLRPGTVFEVAVYVDQLPARAGEETEDVLLLAPPEITGFRLDVWLVATHHFLITDAPIRTVTVPREAPASDVATFRVAVVACPQDDEDPVISASFSCNGRPSGRVTRVVPVVGAPAGESEPTQQAATAPSLEIDLRARVPDLVMEISSLENDDRRFEVRIETPLLRVGRRTESWFLPAEAPALVSTAMAQFFAPDASRAARLRSLEGAGLEFFDSAPTLFKDVYWQLVDAGFTPRSMLVVSDERSIPWELVIPHRRRPEGGREVHQPLGVQLAIGRWHRQSGVSPRQHVPLRTSYVVAPEYRSSARLAHASEEAEFVCSMFEGRRIDPARFDHLDLTLREHGVDLLHFVCHGESDEGGLQLLLLEEPDVLEARQVRAMPGLRKALQESRPMIFLNACDVGRPTRGLVSTAGFAKSFIDLDAACVIGALWSVEDSIAHRVAVEFYDQIFADPSMPFAEALRRIRARGYAEDGEDSYAAYCFYGDPVASSA